MSVSPLPFADKSVDEIDPQPRAGTRNSSGRASPIISPSDDDNGSVQNGCARNLRFRVHGCLNEEDRRKALQPLLLDPFVNTLF
jgi:hypothetical protein